MSDVSGSSTAAPLQPRPIPASMPPRGVWIFFLVVIAGLGGLAVRGSVCSVQEGGLAEYFCPALPSVVLVQSPEVYTRARLLNDRITQQNWLKKQFREDEDEEERQKKFVTPEVVEYLRERALLDLALSSRTPAPQTVAGGTTVAPATPPPPGTRDSSGDKSKAPPLPQTPIGLSTPSQIFQAQREFRQLIRAELFRTQLDDRHDLDGNTAYTLRFPTSVVGPAKPGLIALVDLSVSHPLSGRPKEERRVQEALTYLKDTFEDWRKYVQTSYSTSIASLVKALDDVLERDFSGSEPRLREFGFSAADVRDYFVHKLLCRQNVHFCPPHERDRHAISDWPQLTFLGSRTKTPGSPPMDGSAYSQAEAQTVQYAMHRLDTYLIKHSEATRDAVARNYYARRVERLKTFDGKVQAGHIDDTDLVRREIPIEEAIERCRASRGIPPGALQELAEVRLGLPYVAGSDSVQIVDEGKGVRTVAVAVSVRGPKQPSGGTSAPAAAASQVGSKDSSANTRSSKIWIPIADCPRSPGVYADVREIFRLLRSHRFGPDPYQEFLASGDDNWPTKLGLVGELLDGQENDALSPPWPTWSRKPATGMGSGVLDDSALLRVRDFFNRLEIRLARCREELQQEDPARPDSWRSQTSGCADIVSPTGVTPGRQESVVSRGVPFNWLGEARTTCAAADFTAYQASWPTYIGPDGHAISFSHFFDVIPVRYGLHGCDVEVRPKGQGAKGTALSTSPPTYCKDYAALQGVMTISYEAALCRLLDLVMEDAEFFAYALVPSIEFRRVGQGEELSMSAALSSKDTSVPLVAVLLQQERERTRTTVKSSATIASYINWPTVDPGDGRMQTTANFGWAVLPDPMAANARHFDLSASLSVPGWMKHALVTVRTCWLRVDDVEAQIKRWSKSLRGPCDGSSYSFRIPLPGDSSEINRKLNMAVIKVPHVKALDGLTNEPPQLRAGFPGTIVIPGRRLWKNVAVTLGDQLADDIQVLPDMEGIVAKFDCVNVPLEASTFAIREKPDNPPPGPPHNASGAGNEPPKASGTESKPAAGTERSEPTPIAPATSMQHDADASGRGEGQRAPLVKMTARVWTSEGTTAPIDVFVSTFGKFDLCPRQKPPRTPSSR